MSVAPVLQLEAALLRRQLPDLLLRPGMTLFARVAEREGKHGIIVLAGSPLVAELPDEVQAGDKLRLLVQDTRGERVAMKLVPDEVVQLITASGTADECRAKVREYVDNGCTCPILYPLGPDVNAMIEAFANGDF